MYDPHSTFAFDLNSSQQDDDYDDVDGILETDIDKWHDD